MPDDTTRAAILAKKLGAMPAARHLVTTPLLHTLASRTVGMTGAQIDNLCREAALSALREDIAALKIGESHLLGLLDRAQGTSAATA